MEGAEGADGVEGEEKQKEEEEFDDENKVYKIILESKKRNLNFFIFSLFMHFYF